MGQRFQIYVRYNGGKSLVAYHLQWCWGRYAINRVYQLLDFIDKNLKDTYSNFISDKFDISNRGEYREDKRILENLIQMNITEGSYVAGIDLVKEEQEFAEEPSETFKINPRKQDNNNGIIVIDINNDRKIKYGMTVGYEGEGKYKKFEIVNARQYMEAYQEDLDYIKENLKTEEDNKWYLELLATIEKQIVFTEDFELMTQEEFENMFNKEYKYEDCGVKVPTPF